MWYQINDIPSISGRCVYKLLYYGKYVIVGCRTIQRSVENLNIGLKYFFKNTLKGRNKDDLYYKFYSFIEENPFQSFSIEILFTTDSHFEFLKAEYLALQSAKSDENCLNTLFEPYIPQFTQSNKKKAWLNRGSYLNFMDWKRKYINQNMIA